MGYFHGYKAYKFVREENNCLPINSFNKIFWIYNFDISLKALLYPEIMR
ncbi:hypothetical protein Q757_09725, partial [Oenococcus alcoholitolerans]